MISWKLAVGSLASEKARAISAILGVGAAVGLLAWNVGLVQTTNSQAPTAVMEATRPYSAWITGPAARGPTPQRESSSGERYDGKRAEAGQARGFRRGGRFTASPIPDDLFEAVVNAPCVASHLELETFSTVADIRPNGRVMQGPPMTATVAAIPKSGEAPFPANALVAGRWPDRDSDELEAAVSYAFYDQRKVQYPQLGDELPLVVRSGSVKLKIVGLYSHNPLVSAFPSVYASRAGFDALAKPRGGRPGAGAAKMHGNLLLLEIAKGHGEDELEAVLDTVPESADRCGFTTRGALVERFRSDTANNIARQMPLSMSLAVITSICMLVTVLTSGIAEQRRRIASLRCAGMTRSGVARLIMCETAVLAIIGWIAGVILAAALLQVFLACENSPDLPNAIHLGWQTPAYTLMMAAAVAMIASIAPALSAMKVKPLEVLDADATTPKPVSAAKTILGMALLLPILLMTIPVEGATANILRMLMLAIGMPCFFVGSLLLVHPIMRLIEIALLPLVARLLGLDPNLLSRRISRAPGRSVGPVVTISMGLCSFIAIHIWGGTLMSSYIPSPEWPDVIVSALPGGLTQEQVSAAQSARGVGSRALPIEATQFMLDEVTQKLCESRGHASPSGVLLLFGADPESAFGGESPLAPFKFVSGNRKDAAKAMAEGDACIITAMLRRLTGLDAGDEISVDGTGIRIVGVVDLNWHMVTSRSNVRTQFGKLGGERRGPGGAAAAPQERPMPRNTMGAAFMSEKLARRISGNADTTYFLWLNLDDELKSIHPLQATVRLDASLRDAMQVGDGTVIKVHHRDEIADGTVSHGGNILGTMARIPLWSLLVTSSGIAALLIASARASRRESATMRAVGMTRSQLARLFLGEAILVMLCAVIMSFVGGLLVGWSFTAVTRLSMPAGLPVRLIVPWAIVLKGVLLAAAMCTIMAALPLRKIVDEAGRRD